MIWASNQNEAYIHNFTVPFFSEMYLSISPVSTIEYLDGMFLCGGGFHGGGFLVEDKGETPEQILRWMKKFEKRAIESYNNEAIIKGISD